MMDRLRFEPWILGNCSCVWRREWHFELCFWKYCAGKTVEAVLERRKPRAERLPRRLLLSFGQERSVSARMMAAVTAGRGQSQSGDRVRAI